MALEPVLGVLAAMALVMAAAWAFGLWRGDGGWTDEREWMIIIPNNVYAVDDALTNAYALWALALHARHTERGEGR